MRALTITDVLQMSEKEIEANVVNCGTCPISLLCAAGAPAPGWTFSCCGAGTLTTGTEHYIVDCGKHHFKADVMTSTHMCPLCSGDVVEWDLRYALEDSAPETYLRTTYARVPLSARLSLWRTRHKVVLDILNKDAHTAGHNRQ